MILDGSHMDSNTMVLCVLAFLLLVLSVAVGGRVSFFSSHALFSSSSSKSCSALPVRLQKLVTSRVPLQETLLDKMKIPRGGAETSNKILRIRMSDGSLQRLVLTKEIRALKVSDMLQQLHVVDDNPSQQITSPTIQMDGISISESCFNGLVSELPNLRHGSILSVMGASTDQTTVAPQTSQESSSYIPFPDLHKKWNDRRFQRRHQKSLTSYNALSDYRDATMHRVDEVPNTPRIQRLDICANIASRFIESGDPILLLGTIAEQVDRTRHSLDDHPKKTIVAKVHAMVKTDGENDDDHWKLVAEYLGLRVVGWMVQSTASHDSALVPTSSIILQATDRQLKCMQEDEAPFQGFCTVVVHPSSGATEAYQVTDVAVQMASEGLLSVSDETIFKTCYPILMEGRETTELEAILTLANTAVTSHTGWYSRSKKTSVKSNGRWTKGVRSKLLTSLEKQGDDVTSLGILADFELLASLSRRLNQQEGKELCETVQAYAKGRKKTAVLNSKIRKRLVQILSED